jgi:hypothetical protein
VGRAAVLGVVAATFLAGCTGLPEPESAAAQLYQQRCGGCHRLYAPGVLKFEMWKLTLQRMQGEMARRGAKPLSPEETTLLLDYLQRHSS